MPGLTGTRAAELRHLPWELRRKDIRPSETLPVYMSVSLEA
jgi:hypothetical protein